MKTLVELKKEMIELMEEVYGKVYTYGYIRAAWLVPADTEKVEMEIVQKEIDALKLEKTRRAKGDF